ncbi:MAG: hypothetical protein PVI43_06420, partial [Candidatus Bathyarchaeota archaeon]
MPKAKLKVAEAKVAKPKPWWWKPYWILLVIVSIALNIIIFPSLMNITSEDVMINLIGSLSCIGFAYYIRVRPSVSINRAIYVVGGASGIGFLLWGVIMRSLSASGTLTLIRSSLGELIHVFIASLFIGSYVAAAFMADWIGKKLN